MFEIIPNWHPVFVHFTVALLSLAVGFHIIHPFLPAGKMKQDCYRFAQWNLCLGTGFGIVTAIAGWFAYNSVVHDTPSHAAMTEHRNWALVTLALFLLLASWSLWKERAKQTSSVGFLFVLLIGGGLLLSTAWRGGELVYRYGLGVVSLPQAETEDHDHDSHSQSMPQPQTERMDHSQGNGDEGHELHQEEIAVPDGEIIDSGKTDDGHNHNHSH